MHLEQSCRCFLDPFSRLIPVYNQFKMKPPVMFMLVSKRVFLGPTLMWDNVLERHSPGRRQEPWWLP